MRHRRALLAACTLVFIPVKAAIGQCAESWDGPTPCFNQLGAYPLKRLKAEHGVTLATVTKILGEPPSRTTRSEPSKDYPGVEDRVIVTLEYPLRSVTLSRAVTDKKFEIDRFEERNPEIVLEHCSIRPGQTKHQILRLLGFKTRSSPPDGFTWHHLWCERDLTYEAWATVRLRFHGDSLSAIVWEYWAD